MHGIDGVESAPQLSIKSQDMFVTKKRLEDTIHYVPGSPIVYLNNAKVACSTIKKSLWCSHSPGTYDNVRGPHYRASAPFCRDITQFSDNLTDLLRAEFFTVVRNPYTRILSAYLDKVGRVPRDAAVWIPFARRFRLSGDAIPTFSEFLARVTSEDAFLLDQHFAPQHINTLQLFARCDFIGNIENMDEVRTFLGARQIELISHTPHPTNAVEHIKKNYSSADIEMVRNYYRDDFRVFGYSEDIDILHPVRPPARIYDGRERLKLLIQSFTAGHKDSRQRCIDALAGQIKGFSATYYTLENGAFHPMQLKELGEQAIQGEFKCWKLVARIAEELLRNDMLREGAAVAHRARLLAGQ